MFGFFIILFSFFVLAFFDSSLLSCHFWPFTDVQNGNQHEVTPQVADAVVPAAIRLVLPRAGDTPVTTAVALAESAWLRRP